MMTQELQDFVDTLPDDIREMVAGKRNKGVLRVLDEQGIQVPQDVLDVIASRSVDLTHEELLDRMRGFAGNRLSDFPTIRQH